MTLISEAKEQEDDGKYGWYMLNSTAFMTEKPRPRFDASTTEGSETRSARAESILA
ncbi:MAG: hypothetical protein QOJ58_2732, partial [Alphaproteobacteria bacterium]|nr:hypothetical protein [Alphaproteobacteria bacterium]